MGVTSAKLSFEQVFDIEDALIMFIDYLKDGDEDDKKRAERVQETYDHFEEETIKGADHEADS